MPMVVTNATVSGNPNAYANQSLVDLFCGLEFRSGRCLVIMKPSRDPLRVFICLGLLEFYRDDIRTVDQLRTVAEHLVRIEGFGPITARTIKQELNRAAGRESNCSTTGSFLRGVHDSDNS